VIAMTTEKALLNIKSMGKAISTADQRKNATKSSVSRAPQVLLDGNADSTTFTIQKKNSGNHRDNLH